MYAVYLLILFFTGTSPLPGIEAPSECVRLISCTSPRTWIRDKYVAKLYLHGCLRPVHAYTRLGGGAHALWFVGAAGGGGWVHE